jgi:DNA-binding transcriptional LysR family regulator
VADRYDIGVRLGGDVAKDMIAVRMAPDLRLLVVGTPGYFAARTRPTTPQQLTEHDCIGLRLPTYGGLMTWEFRRRGRGVHVHVSGRLVFSAGDMVLSAALAGYGLAWVPEEQAAPHLEAGRLVQVLADWTIAWPGYHLYYATRRASPALALVVDALRMPT